MTRRKTNAQPEVEATVTVEGQADPFAQIHVDLLDVLGQPICDHGNFRQGFKIAPVARAIGVSQMQTSKYLLTGEGLGTKSLRKVSEFIAGKRGTDTEEKAAALAEVASL